MYILDSDVMITAKNTYYDPNFCVGFWQCLIDQHLAGNVVSIDKVKDEINAPNGTDVLKDWVADVAPDSLFETTQATDVLTSYGQILTWVNARTQLVQAARDDYASSADGWLCAYCHARGHTLVTLEVGAPHSRARVKIPDVCDAHGIEHCNTFEMLRQLGVQI